MLWDNCCVIYCLLFRWVPVMIIELLYWICVVFVITLYCLDFVWVWLVWLWFCWCLLSLLVGRRLVTGLISLWWVLWIWLARFGFDACLVLPGRFGCGLAASCFACVGWVGLWCDLVCWFCFVWFDSVAYSLVCWLGWFWFRLFVLGFGCGLFGVALLAVYGVWLIYSVLGCCLVLVCLRRWVFVISLLLFCCIWICAVITLIYWLIDLGFRGGYFVVGFLGWEFGFSGVRILVVFLFSW